MDRRYRTVAATACRACGAELRAHARFCDECGAPTTASTRPAEYKQVTVLFADVVHSMDIAAAVGPERLRELMTELVNRSSTVVQRYGGTVDKFTGDGIMAVLVRRWRWRITLFAHALLPLTFRRTCEILQPM
jgi:adenylate cyclase